MGRCRSSEMLLIAISLCRLSVPISMINQNAAFTTVMVAQLITLSSVTLSQAFRKWPAVQIRAAD